MYFVNIFQGLIINTNRQGIFCIFLRFVLFIGPLPTIRQYDDHRFTIVGGIWAVLDMLQYPLIAMGGTSLDIQEIAVRMQCNSQSPKYA